MTSVEYIDIDDEDDDLKVASPPAKKARPAANGDDRVKEVCFFVEMI